MLPDYAWGMHIYDVYDTCFKYLLVIRIYYD